MRKLAAVTTVLVVLALLPASASAIKPLGKAEAKAAATERLQRYYDYTWRYATYKSVGQGKRVSSTRWRLAYQFFPEEAEEACYGVVTVWRGRANRIFAAIEPNPEQTEPICR